MRKHLLLLTIAFFSFNLLAQQECAFILEEAQEMFDAGLIETVPDNLSECLNTGFTNEEKLQAYKLIILSYLFDDNIEKADEFMLQFLTDYPAYEPVATDPREFVLLMETYDTDPILMLGGGGGVNFSFPLLTEPLGVYNLKAPGASPNLVPGRTGFHAGFRIEREIKPQLNLLMELVGANIVFDSYLDDEREPIVPSAEVTDYSVTEYYESQTQLRLPLSISYDFTSTDFKPYVRLGIEPGILFSARAEGRRVYLPDLGTGKSPIDVANIVVMDVRRRINVWAVAGTGFSYKLGPGNVFLDLRYHFNLLNQLKPGSDPYQFQKLTWSLYYVPEKFLLNNVSISLGYMFPLYRPKKKDQ